MSTEDTKTASTPGPEELASRIASAVGVMETRIIGALKVLEHARTKNQVRRSVQPERVGLGVYAFDKAWEGLLERHVIVSSDTPGRRYWLSPEWRENLVAS